MARTAPCPRAVGEGRRSKARQFLDAARRIATPDDSGDSADAIVTLCVHAGIAGADAVCCARLGVHALGDNHQEAIALLRTVDAALAKDLAVLLSIKTRAAYSAQPSNAADRHRAERAADRLVEAASVLR